MRIKNQSGIGVVEMLLAVLVIAVAAFVVYTVVENRDDEEDKVKTSDNSNQSDDDYFSLRLSNLQPLDQGVYEGWVVSGDNKTSFGTFNINADDEIVGDVSYDDVKPADGDKIVITIEPDNDSDPEPSATVILTGDVSGKTVDLAFPVDVSTFAGQYILGTPTTSATDDETAGIWFTQTGSEALLNIPVAPDGWIYEGWAVYDGTPLTTGQFADPAKADLFNGYSGPGNAPDKPGEDYIQNLPNGLEGPLALDNGTTKVVVSLEPYQNGADPTGEGPAQVKPLSHTIGSGVADHSAFDLEVSTDSVPSGVATIK